MSLEQLLASLREGHIAPDDFVWRPGFAQWLRASEISELQGPPPLPDRVAGHSGLDAARRSPRAEPAAPNPFIKILASLGIFALSAVVVGLIKDVAEPNFERVFAVASINVGALYGIYYVWARWGKAKRHDTPPV
jgi:hypothetical protein